MSPFDGTVANVALPSISRSLRTGVDSAEWVLLTYLLVTAATLPLFGRLSDMLGGKRIYLAGFAVFAAGSLVCVLAPSLVILVAARALQGLGAAMLMSTSLALITAAFPASERGRAIGMNGAAVAAGLTLGPIIGGTILTFADWRWIFLINVPISALALILTRAVLRPGRESPQRFDFAGMSLAAAALFGLTLGLSRAHVWGWASPLTIGLLVASSLLVIFFIRVERRTGAPMLDLRLFSNRTFTFSVLASALYFWAAYSVVFTVPLAAQTALRMNPLQAGFLLLPISALNIVFAPVAGALSDRLNARYLSTAGAILFAAGAFWMSALPAIPGFWRIAMVLAIIGLGGAVFTQPNNSAIMGSAPEAHRGIASGVLATARTTGQVMGIAMAGAIYFLRSNELGAFGPAFAPAKAVFLAVAVLMAIAAALSYARPSKTAAGTF